MAFSVRRPVWTPPRWTSNPRQRYASMPCSRSGTQIMTWSMRVSTLTPPCCRAPASYRLAFGRLPAAQLVLKSRHPLGGVDDEALVRALAGRLHLVAHVHTKHESPPVDLRDLHGDGHGHPHDRAGEMRHVDARADRKSVV